MNAYESLLEWASERGQGSWSEWKDACGYVELAAGRRIEPTMAANRLSALGHVEFDWVHNRFAAAPTTAVLIPKSSGCVIVTGARPRRLRSDLESVFSRDDINVWVHPPIPQEGGPDTWLIECEMDDVQKFCREASLLFEYDSGRRMAQDMCPIVTFDSAAVSKNPDERYPRLWLDPGSKKFNPVSRSPDEYGLWHVDSNRRREAYILNQKGWFYVPVREYGPYLAYPEVEFIRYNEQTHCLDVSDVAHLSGLLARALTLQSGRLPIRLKAGFHTYVNIDSALASAVQDRLRTNVRGITDES